MYFEQPVQIFDQLDLQMERLRQIIINPIYCECPKHGKARAFNDNSCKECHQEKSIIHQERLYEEQIICKKKILTNKLEFINARFNNYKIENQEQQDIVNFFYRYKADRNVLLNGLPGCGKTHLAWALIDKFMREGVSVHYFNYYSIVDVKSQYPETYKKAINCQLLIIDEVGLVDSDKREEYFNEIIENKYKNGALMLISNLPNKSLQSMMNKSSYTKFIENYIHLYTKWQDYRIKHK